MTTFIIRLVAILYRLLMAIIMAQFESKFTGPLVEPFKPLETFILVGIL